MSFLTNLFSRPTKQSTSSQKQQASVRLTPGIRDVTAVTQLVDDGVAKKRSGDYRGVKESYYKAIQIDPTQRMSYYSLAKICYLLGEKEESIANYLRSAHISIPALAEVISSNANSRRAFEDQFRQLPSDIRSTLQTTHKYAAYLLADPDTPCHVAHAILDLGNDTPVTGDLTKHIAAYKRVLSGDSKELDYSIEDQTYRLVGIGFLLNNLRWDKLGDRDVLNIYPDPKPKPASKLQTVRVANRNTVFSMMFYSLLEAGCFSISGAQLTASSRSIDSGRGLDASGALSNPKDQQIIHTVSEILDSYPSLPSPTTGALNEEEFTRSIHRFKANLKKLDQIAPGAEKICRNIITQPMCARFNWPEDLIRADVGEGRGLRFVSKKQLYDDNGIHLGIEYYFELDVSATNCEQPNSDHAARNEQTELHNTQEIAPNHETEVENDVSTPQPQGKVTILGKDYPLYMSPFRLKGQTAQIGVSLEFAFFECGMLHRRDGRQDQVCGAKLGIVADFIPSAWRCPVCNGLMILDTLSGSDKYKQPSLIVEITNEVGAYCYFAERIHGDHQAKFLRWLDKRINGQGIFTASTCEDSFMGPMISPGKITVVPLFISVEQLEQYQTATVPQHSLLAKAHLLDGVGHFQQGHVNEAVREIEESIRINPDSARPHYCLGVVYQAQNRMTDAINEYKAALRINPDIAEAHYNLGAIYGPQGRIKEAIHEFEEALRITPNDPEIHANLGMAYGEQGRVSDEVREYLTAIRLDPNLAMPHYNLGVTYVQQGRTNEGVSELRMARQLGHPMASQMLTRLGVGF